MNLNHLAMDIAYKEGKKINVNIAQIKEIIKLLLEDLAVYPSAEVAALMAKYAKRVRKKKKV